MAAQQDDKAGVIAFPPLIFGSAYVLGLLIHFMFPRSFMPQMPALWLGTLLILVAGLVVLSAFRALAHARTAINTSKATTAIVTDGAYRYSRNPMYLSGTLLYIGIASLVNSLWLILLVVPLMVVIQRGVIEQEEQYLERKFGEEYLRYKKRVRRWI